MQRIAPLRLRPHQPPLLAMRVLVRLEMARFAARFAAARTLKPGSNAGCKAVAATSGFKYAALPDLMCVTARCRSLAELGVELRSQPQCARRRVQL